MGLDKQAKDGIVFRTTSEKSIREFIEGVDENASTFGFGVREIFNMREMYEAHDVRVSDGFEVYSIMICNFQKSYQSIQKNPQRAAVLLEPKQIVVHSESGTTIIDYLPFTKEFIQQALPEDEDFWRSLYDSCQRIVRLIEASK